MDDPDEHPVHVEVEKGSPETYLAYFAGRPEPVYLTYQQYHNYLAGLPLNATRRHAAEKFREVLTSPTGLKAHATSLGVHTGKKPGSKSKHSKGALLDGERYLVLQAEGKSLRDIADKENERRRSVNEKIEDWNRRCRPSKRKRLLKEVDEDAVRSSMVYARRARRDRK